MTVDADIRLPRIRTAAPVRPSQSLRAGLVQLGRTVEQLALDLAALAAQASDEDMRAAARRLSIETHRLRAVLSPLDTATTVIAEVAAQMGLAPADILSRTRSDPLVRARWMVMELLRVRGFSMPEIGRVLGLDHSTVLHGMRRLAEIEHRGAREADAAEAAAAPWMFASRRRSE